LSKLNYPLVSNLNHSIPRKSNMLTTQTFAFPGLFIIDKEDIIQYYTINNLLCGRSIN